MAPDARIYDRIEITDAVKAKIRTGAVIEEVKEKKKTKKKDSKE